MIDKTNGITLEHLAGECGVSVATMHRYLKRPHLLKESTRKKLQDKLHHNKKFNDSIITSSLDGIALFIHDPKLLMTSDVIRAIQGILHKHTMNITIVDSNNEMELKTALMKNKNILGTVNGVIALSFDTYKDYSLINQKYNIPIIVLNSRGNKIGMTFNNNNYQAGQDAAEYLIKKGYKKIGFVGWDLEDKHLYDRYIGWKQICSNHNIEHEHTLATITPEGGYIACKEIMETMKPDAIFFACDAMALGGFNYLSGVNIKLGEELGVLGFDNILASSFIGLSTMDQFIEEKVMQAIEYILQFNKNEDYTFAPQEISFTPKIIERKTTMRDNK